MKKIILSLCVALMSVGAFAADEYYEEEAKAGDWGVGLNIGMGTRNPVVNIGMGAKIQYYLTDALRSEVSYNGFFKSSHITYWDLNLNLHYVFNMKYGLAIYPIVGVTFVHGHYKNNERIEELETNFWELFLFGTTDKMYNDREGSIGFNVGAGIQYAIIPNLYANIEGVFKYAGTKDLGPYNAQIGPRFQTTVGLTYRF